jgi:SAM-dependent methyltransferase
VTCCAPKGYRELFGERAARRDARRYRRKGLDETAERMVDFLRGRGLGDATVLEVGGGVGAIGLELLKAGAARSVNLELSAAYARPARQLALEAGVEDRVELELVDLAEDPEAVAVADLVVLHRVVCCYPEADRLVGAAAGRARRTLVLSYPPRSWWMRAFAAGVNTAMRLLRREYRTYAHRPREFLGAAEARGLERRLAAVSWPWRIAALDRTPGVASVT